MRHENICHFIPYSRDKDQLSTINFVLETKPQIFTALKTEALYKMYFVCTGQGFLHTLGRITPLSAGDIFFTFPAEAFAIASDEGFEYMYISFLGARGNMILEQLKISRTNCIFHGFSALKSFWQNAIEVQSELPDLTSESVLLYTFSYLGQSKLASEQKSLLKGHAWAQIKKYIDDHFTDSALCLKFLGEELGYNPKYISSVFKKHTGLGVVEYLNTTRIQHGCTLIAQGFTSIGDISTQSGFSDPQYFSRVFKKIMGVTPAQYIQTSK